MYLYTISNDIDDKLYIGSTTMTLLHRWQWHLIDLEKGNTRQLYVHMRTLGFEHFSINIAGVIDSLSNGLKLEMFEQMLMDSYPRERLLNMQRAYDTRTLEQKKADQKLYYRNKRSTVICPQCGHTVDIAYMDKHVQTPYHRRHSVNPIVAPTAV